jgi:hypothetical protein
MVVPLLQKLEKQSLKEIIILVNTVGIEEELLRLKFGRLLASVLKFLHQNPLLGYKDEILGLGRNHFLLK